MGARVSTPRRAAHGAGSKQGKPAPDADKVIDRSSAHQSPAKFLDDSAVASAAPPPQSTFASRQLSFPPPKTSTAPAAAAAAANDDDDSTKAAAAAAAARAAALGRLTSSLSDLASLAAGSTDGGGGSSHFDRSSSNHSRGGATTANGDERDDDGTNSSAATAGAGGSNRGTFLSPAVDARVGHILQLACAISRCSDAAVLLEDGSLLTAKAAPPSKLAKSAAASAAAAGAAALPAADASSASADNASPSAAAAAAPAASLLAWLSSSSALPFIPKTPPGKAEEQGGHDDDDDDEEDLEGDEASASSAAAPSSTTAASTVIAVADLSVDERFEAPLLRRELLARGHRRRSTGDRDNSAPPLPKGEPLLLQLPPLPLPRFFAAAAVVGGASGRRLGTLAVADAAPFPLPPGSEGEGGSSSSGPPPRAMTPLEGCPAPPDHVAPSSCCCSSSCPSSQSSSPLTGAESALLASLADMVARGLAADAAVASARARGAALLTMVDSGAPPYLIVELSSVTSLFPSARNAASEEDREDVWSVVHASPAAAALLLPSPPVLPASRPPAPSSSLSSSSPAPPPPPPPQPSLIPRNTRLWELLFPAVASCSSAAAAAAATAAAATAAAAQEPPRPFVMRGLCPAAVATAAAAAAAEGGCYPGCSILTATFTPATGEEEREAAVTAAEEEEVEEAAVGGGGEGEEGIERMRRFQPPPPPPLLPSPPTPAASAAPTAPGAPPLPRKKLFRVELSVAHAATAAAATPSYCCYAPKSASSAPSQANASANPFGAQLLLGPLLGQGSHGRVFCGEWRGRRVAVKVARSAAVRRRPGDGAPLEAVVAAPPCHRGVVACFAAADSPALLLVGDNGGEKASAAPRAAASAAAAASGGERAVAGAGEAEERRRDSGSSGGSSGLFMWDSASSSSREAREAVTEAAARDARERAAAGATAATTTATTETTTLPPLPPPAVDASRSPSEEASETWFVLELCDGGTLAEALGRGVFRLGAAGAVVPSSGLAGDNKRPPTTATALARARAAAATAADVAEALDWLHSRGVSHGDLTCSNVLLCSYSPAGGDGEEKEEEDAEGDTRKYRAKISDFGLAACDASPLLSAPFVSSCSSSSPSSRPLPPHGTVTHMPPERLAGSAPSPEADVYSLGCVLWSMLAASLPWAGVAAPQVVRRVGIEGMTLPVPPPPDGCAGSTDLEAVLRQCLESEPSRRPSAEEAARRLREVARRL